MKEYLWALWLIALFAALVFVMLFQVNIADARIPDEEQCIEMTARRHDNFAAVFQYFPEREGWAGHYIATDCISIGNRYVLWFQGKRFDVVVADCKNRSEPQGSYPPFDIDKATWLAAGAPSAPTAAMLCIPQ